MNALCIITDTTGGLKALKMILVCHVGLVKNTLLKPFVCEMLPAYGAFYYNTHDIMSPLGTPRIKL